MIAASPLSPDEYAMRIATQTESALICKEYSSPFIVSRIPVFPAPQRTPCTHRTGRRANRPPPCSLLATVKRDIGRPVACVVCLAISPAVCRLFLLAFDGLLISVTLRSNTRAIGIPRLNLYQVTRTASELASTLQTSTCRQPGIKKKRVCKEKLTDATAGVTKLEPALTLIPVLMRGKCI
ncbi:uncharacterized protein TNCV_3868701 [Trichonephila clavipes]|nr:uncharacterized protein TNCV_3868701 [Trichonephila clavipes]